jgi:hypothetical protein
LVSTGDLIDALYVDVLVKNTGRKATLGETLLVSAEDELVLRVRFRAPDGKNGGGFQPQVQRVDVIQGVVSGPVQNRNSDEAPNTKVTKRFYASDWQTKRGYSEFRLALGKVNHSGYLRLRGTNNKDEHEPEADAKGENPWHDLWFYSNPVFIKLTDTKH